MKKLPLRWAMMAALTAAASLYGIYYQGKRTGYRMAASDAVQNSIVADQNFAAKLAEAELTAELAARKAERKRIEAELAAAKAVSEQEAAAKLAPPAEPYTSSNGETSDAVAQFTKAGGFILPKRLYAIAGEPVGIYLATIVPVADPEVFRYTISCSCDFATLERRRILLSPSLQAKGKHKFEIEARTLSGVSVAKAEMDIVLAAPDAGLGANFQMLLVGDSLGHQSRFPNELARMMARPGNPTVTFVGSHRPAGANIPHEQYGGWRFIYFSTIIGQEPKYYHRDRSPFVFPGPDGKPDFDVGRYLNETLAGARPRNVHIQLGINDAFALDPDAPNHEQELTEILRHADILIGGLKKALPDAVITVGSVIQANAADRAYIESYRPYRQFHSAARWRRGQMALARRMIAHFESRSAERVYLVPTHMTVDPLDGYNAHVWVPDGVDYGLSNAVHPAPLGDRQLAAAIFATVKAELSNLTVSDAD